MTIDKSNSLKSVTIPSDKAINADGNGTIFIIMRCPGSKVPIRTEPKVDAETLSFATSGDKFEVYKRTTAGFWKILDKKVSFITYAAL